MRSTDKLLFDIADAVRLALKYMQGMDRAAYDADSRTQDAVIRRLEIIGEAAKNLPASWRSEHPSIPWRDISRMRDRLIHHYFRVDDDIIWEVLTLRLPILVTYLQPFVTAILVDEEGETTD